MTNKFDSYVNSILEEGIMGNIKAAAKTAVKLPFKAAGGLTKKIVNPAAWLRGAANVVGGANKLLSVPGKAIDTAHQIVQSGDVVSPVANALQSGLQGAANVASKTGQAIAGYYQKQKTSGGSNALKGLNLGLKNAVGTASGAAKNATSYANSVLYNVGAMARAAIGQNSPFTFPKGISDPKRLKVGDTFTQINKKTGQATAYTVVDKSRDGQNIVAAPVEFYK